MSQQLQVTPEQATQAFKTVEANLDAPVFFKKLASDYGIVPQSEQEALDLMALGGSLQQAFNANQAKQASVAPHGQSRFSGFVGELTGHTGQADADNERLIKQAAVEAAQDPTFAASILTLHAARAQQLASQEAA